MSELKNQVEAILFAAGKKVTYEDLARLGNADISSVKSEIQILKREYEERDSPLILAEEADGWKMTVREKYLSAVHKMLPDTEISKSVLETLAVIAWKQPVLQSEVIKIRTNKAYEHIEELVERGFISKEKKGRSYLLKVTQKFNEYFELPNKEAIKKIFEDIQKQMQLEQEGEEEKEHLGKLEVFDEEQPSEKKEKIRVYDNKEEAGEEDVEESEEKEAAEESPEEEKTGETSEVEEKIKKIQEAKKRLQASAPEKEEEAEEEPEPEQEQPAEEEEEEPKIEIKEEKKETEGEEEDRRELSPELEEIAGDRDRKK